MPTYQYACTQCGHAFEQFQSFSDDALTVCPSCGGKLRKVFNAVGVVFKGSGFYRNDSRSTTSSSDAPSEKSEKSEKSGEKSSGTPEKSGTSEKSGKPSAPAGSGDSKPAAGTTTSSTAKD